MACGTRPGPLHNRADLRLEFAANRPVNGTERIGQMPLVTAFNLRADDRLPAIEEALRLALTSMPELGINDFEVDLVPVLAPAGFHGTVTRINVDLWEGPRAARMLSRSSPHESPQDSKPLPDAIGR
jgi:hypothetical protein